MSPATHSRLCYLDAADVRGPFLSLDHVKIRDNQDAEIGHLDGIVFDPAARHVQYLVISSAGAFRRHRYLLPFVPARIDVERQVLRVDMPKGELKRCERFEPGSFHRYGDADLLTALFPDVDEDELPIH